MGANKDVVKKQIDDLKDYTETVAAVHLLNEVVNNGAQVEIGVAKEALKLENAKKNPSIENVIKSILVQAGKPGKSAQWEIKDGKHHIEAAITVGGGIYTVDIIFDGKDKEKGVQNYIVNITSKVEKEKATRGKLFFDEGHSATVKLTYDKEGDLRAVSKNGLAINNKFPDCFIPFAYQNEILTKFHDSLKDGKEQRLAVMGTGSGKSIVMAGVAQAVGRTVMIVPDKLLVTQQTGDVKDMHGKGLVNGKKKTPNVFTFDDVIKNVDVAWDDLINEEKRQALKNEVEKSEWDKMSNDWDWLVEKNAVDWDKLEEEDKSKIKDYFAKVMANTTDPKFDQLVLQAELPLFKIVADQIKDTMVLIDESHRHTFNEEDAQLLVGITKKNSVLALTATPTSKLYDLFKGEPLDDLSLGAAIELGTIRPIKPEVDYLEEKDLVDQAVLHYFDDYYLEDWMSGYVDPVELKKQFISKDGLGEVAAQEKAINQALEMNRIRCQRNLGFSDDKETRVKLAETYQKIANGDQPTIEKYQDEVAKLRQKSEAEARLKLNQKFGAVDEEEFKKHVVKPVVNLKKDIAIEQQKDIQRTINSYALALVFNDKYVNIAEKDRTHKLEDFLKECDENIQKYKKVNEKEIPPPFKKKLDECGTKNRAKLEEAFNQLPSSPIPKLPADQKEAILKLILDRGEAILERIKKSEPISDIISQADPLDLVKLRATENYASTMDMTSGPSTKREQLAQIEVGLKTHIVADQVIATGVSIRDILNVQMINSYSPVIESDINVINGVLSGPQAAGRCVRNKDTEARAQQYIDKRYEADLDKRLILTVDEIIDPADSAAKTRKVMENREEQAKKEENAVVRIQKTVRGVQTARLFKEHKSLSTQIDDLEKDLDVAVGKLKDINKSLEIHKRAQKNQDLVDAEYELSFVPGRKEGNSLPTEYARNSSFYLYHVRSTLLRESLDIPKDAAIKVAKKSVDAETVGKDPIDALIKIGKEPKNTVITVDEEIAKLEKLASELQDIIQSGTLKLEVLRDRDEQLEEKLGIKSSVVL